MKQILSFILVIILLFSCASCNQENESSESTSSETEVKETDADTTEKVTEAEETTTSEDTTVAPETTVTEDTTEQDTTKVEETTAALETTVVPETTIDPETTVIPDTTIAPETTVIPETTPAKCAHTETELVGAKTATCAENGYSGDTKCKKCGDIIATGQTTPKSASHGATTIVNAKEATTDAEGYTGDTVCSVCNTVTAKGQVIPKKAEETKLIVCEDAFGNQLTVPEGTNILDYSLNKANIPATTSKYAQLEAEILRLTNIERQKAGVPALDAEPKAYYFASVRAEEASVLWDHVRPNGQMFYQIYAEKGVFYLNCGENLYACTGYSSAQLQNDAEFISKYAKEAVEGWMNSPGHKANILDPDFTSLVIGIFVDEANNEAYAVQLFLD